VFADRSPPTQAPSSSRAPLICFTTGILFVAFVILCSRRIETEGNEGNEAHQFATTAEHLSATRFGLIARSIHEATSRLDPFSMLATLDSPAGCNPAYPGQVFSPLIED
jgi:hypothetical protein